MTIIAKLSTVASNVRLHQIVKSNDELSQRNQLYIKIQNTCIKCNTINDNNKYIYHKMKLTQSSA